MAHDVFISHSIKDATTAHVICYTLESRGIRCWIGPRDVPTGSNYADCITRAIQHSKALLLVFSENSDTSIHVAREVDAAINLRIPLIPVRIASVSPSVAMKLRLSQTQWLDAFEQPLNHYKNQIVTRTWDALKVPGIMVVVRPLWMRWRKVGIGAAAVVAVALSAAKLMAVNPPGGELELQTTPLSGSWQLEASDCVLGIGSGNGFGVKYHFSGDCSGPLRGAAGTIAMWPKGMGLPGLHEGDDGTFSMFNKKTYQSFPGSFRKSTGFLGIGHKSMVLHADALPTGTWQQISEHDPQDDPK